MRKFLAVAVMSLAVLSLSGNAMAVKLPTTVTVQTLSANNSTVNVKVLVRKNGKPNANRYVSMETYASACKCWRHVRSSPTGADGVMGFSFRESHGLRAYRFLVFETATAEGVITRPYFLLV